MKNTEAPSVKYLKDYKKPTHKIGHIYLELDLYDENTHVTNKMTVTPEKGETTLELNGEELTLLSIHVNGEKLESDRYQLEGEVLIINDLPTEQFELIIENTNNPIKNTALDGLYKSGGIFCTQCEPEGFRRITYSLDRPDNLAIYTTKVIADKEFPILLSNGNLLEKGELENGRHFAIWNDPFPKPSYLYALVAGDLGMVKDTYTTKSGREVRLEIYVDKGNEGKCEHAMLSLKNSMKWDEERFGLEYDLDIYMIVAVDSFNMGAMENKGLNIFNSAYVLADRETATDSDFFGVESVIGHEYFHNWTGNRVTCRDWFQLTLKEGLTVFRDQEFSADLNSRAVCRIDNVMGLRGHQFIEDSGPNAHPIKPKSYIEMNNFYTSTVYEKGSEVIRMIHTLLGEEGFQKGMKLYFEKFDGQAVTTEDFVWAMSHANGDYDFSQFTLWYDQAGTPEVNVKSTFENEKLTLVITQTCPDTPGQTNKKPFFIPLAFGLVTDSGVDFNLSESNIVSGNVDLERSIIHLKEKEMTVIFDGITEKVVPSINRGFSAPIKLKTDLSMDDVSFLMANDKDEFNRYEASQVYAMDILKSLLAGKEEIPAEYEIAFDKILDDHSIDNAFKARCISLPSLNEIVRTKEVYDYAAAKKAKDKLISHLTARFYDEMTEMYKSLADDGEFSVDAEAMGRRALKNTILGYLSYSQKSNDLIREQYVNATNMTDQYAALSIMIEMNHPSLSNVLEDFYHKYEKQTLVMQKWLRAQAFSSHDSCYDRIFELQKCPVYDENVPNLVRALITSFAYNPVQFNHESGRGVRLVVSEMLKIDKKNPQMASGMAKAFANIKHMPEGLKEITISELKSVLEVEELSKNTYEIVSKTLDSL